MHDVSDLVFYTIFCKQIVSYKFKEGGGGKDEKPLDAGNALSYAANIFWSKGRILTHSSRKQGRKVDSGHFTRILDECTMSPLDE